MKAALGVVAVVLGASAALLGVVTLAVGLRRNDPKLLELGRRYVFALLAAALLAVGVMEWALLTHDYSLRYVAENNARGTPLLFTITGLWAALEGSILLWGLILAGYLAVTAHRFRHRAADPLVAWATLVGLLVALFFFALMLGPANPFKAMATIPLDGRGPNPLLQNHPLMAFHPPMLYLGYVGFTIPFSFAIAALVTGRFGEGWLADTRRSTLVAWGFLTAGIILGAWWSYEVLGWGGFWAWDPVENASLLPWLTGTAFIHSVLVQERRGMLRVWNLSLVVATFSLTILGTFLTRSGVLNSVHAFSESDIGPWLLGFLGVVVASSIGLIAWRGDALRAPGRIDSPISREAAFLGNNLLFAGLAFIVLLGTVYPLLAEALRSQQLSVGEPYFDTMGTPLGLALLFIMAAAPALPWRAASGEVVRHRLVVPAWIGAGTMVAAVALGTRGLVPVLAFGLAAFALANIGRTVWVALRSRRRAYRETWFTAGRRMVSGNPRLYGGLVVHAGVVVIAIALASFGTFGSRREVRLERGQSTTVAGYTVTFLGASTDRSAQKVTRSARFRLVRGDDVLGVYAPSISSFPNSSQGIGTPSVRTGLKEDVYLTLVSSPSASDRVTVGVAVNPMVLWLWIGGGVMVVGTIVALLPVRRRERDPRDPASAPRAARRAADRRRGGGPGVKHPLRWAVLGIGTLVALFGVVLSTQMGTSPQYAGGPIIDRKAPAFDLPVLDGDGTRVDLPSLAGKSVIVNFWNSWCIPCQEETPALNAFWERHADDPDVALIGIVRDDTSSAARGYAQEHGLGYTIALDPKGEAALAYGTTGQPETYAISPSGVVTGKQLSRVSVNDLEALLGSAQAG